MHGPDRFRFEELPPEDFEELCFLLARLEALEVRRLRAPDGGLDAAIFESGDVAVRGWQAKRHRNIDWADLEASLAAARDRYQVKRVTFCLAKDLTAVQRRHFVERLESRYPEVELDYWDASELTSRLLSPAAEVIRDRFFRRGEKPRAPFNRERLRPLAETSWQELGVSRGALLADDEGWTIKVARLVDSELAERLGGWGQGQQPSNRFVVLSGPSGSGKTRALLDGLRQNLPKSTLVLSPQNAIEAREIAEGWHRLPGDGDQPVVLWLDDLERFLRLDEAGLTRGALQQLISQDPNLLVVATCHGKGLSLLPSNQRQIDTLLDTVVDYAGVHLRIAHQLSAEELGDVAASGVLSPAIVDDIAEVGIGPYVLGVERLRDKLARDAVPHHGALVEAALDWAACAIRDPLERGALRQLWERRLPGEPTDALFEEALDWAQRPVIGKVALLARAGDGYLPSLLLADEHREKLDKEAVAAVLDLADQPQAEALALSAAGSAAAEAAIEQLADESHGPKIGGVASGFAISLIAAKKNEKGLEWLRRAASEGDVQGVRNLGITLYRKGKSEEALKAFERADAMGDGVAANGAAALLEKEGRHDEALEAFRRADERGDDQGSFNLAVALEERGEQEEAEEVYRRAMERGSADAATVLGVLIGNRGNHEEALELFRVADERGDREGSCNLGFALQRVGDEEGAMAAFKRADDRGDPNAPLVIGTKLLDEDLDQALAALNRADSRGSADGADVLGQVLEQMRLLDFAEAAYRRADERGSGIGAAHLGMLLEFWDADEEAEEAYRRADERDEIVGTEQLGRLLMEKDDPEASEILDRADRGGSAEAALALGAKYASEGNFEAALGPLRRGVERGSARAAQVLGELHLFERVGEPRHEALAEEALRRADGLQSPDAGYLLGCLLSSRPGPHDEAEEAFRRADSRGSAAAALALGEMHEQAAEFAQALDCYGRAEHRGDPRGACGIGHVFIALDKPQEAKQAFLRALAGGVEKVAIDLAYLLANESDFVSAMTLLEDAVDRGVGGAEEELTEMRAFVDRLESELRAADDHDSRFQLAALLHRCGRLDEAIVAYRACAEQGDGEAAVQLGNILADREEMDEALSAYRPAVDQGYGKAAFLVAFRLSQMGDEEGAREGWVRADELGEGGGSCRLGGILLEEGRLDEAEEAYQRAVERGHGHGALMNGELLRKRGRTKRAVEWMRRAESMGQDRAAVQLGRLLLAEEQTEEALAAFARADERGSADGAYERGRLLLDSRKVPEAIGALQRAESREHEQAMLLLTQTLVLIGRSREAERLARRWHERGNGTAGYNLAIIRFFRGDSEARDLLDQVIQAQIPLDKGFLHYLRGFVSFSSADFEAAVADLQIAREAGIANLESMQEAARMFGFQGDEAEKKKELQALYDRGNPLIARSLGERAREEGDLELAEEALKKAFDHGGREVGEELASLLDELHEPEEALKVRERVQRLSLYDDPMLRPMQGFAESNLKAGNVAWLHSEAFQRGMGFLPMEDEGKPEIEA